MNYKLSGALKKNRINLILFLILWIFLAIVLIAPITYAWSQAVINGKMDISIFVQKIITSPFEAFGKLIEDGNFGSYLKTLIGGTLVYLVFVTIGLIKTAPKHKYTDIEHGSSDWSEGGEQYRILNSKKGIILGEKNYLPEDKRGNINVLVVGGSGSGKSASYSIPNAYQMLGSYVFTDPKGELYDKTAGYLKKNGYDIKVLNLVNPAQSDGYNPLLHINSERDVDVIASTVVRGQKSDAGGSDPFWDDSAEMLLKALIYYLIATRPEEEQNLASCAELVRAASKSTGSNILADLINKLPYDHPARTNFKSIELASDKTYSSILSTLQSKLGKFDSREIAAVTSTNTINFEDIGTKKTAVYVISPDTHTAYNFILTIFFAQMINQLYNLADENKGGKLKEPVYFILDEFANIGQIPDFDQKISTSRSRKISFSVILQNLDQLEAIYEKSYETIMGNCDTHLFLGSNSYKTLEYFSKALGEKTIGRDSISVNKDKGNHKTGKSVSDQVMARALMTPDELRRMDVDECIIFVKGLRPVRTNKFYYFKHSMEKELEKYEVSHNDIEELDRGEWRKFNPINPWVPEREDNEVENLKVESLDDLFESQPTKMEPVREEEINKKDNDVLAQIEESDDISPMLPQLEEDEEEFDLQKEFEAKFDELFGTIDDDN